MVRRKKRTVEIKEGNMNGIKMCTSLSSPILHFVISRKFFLDQVPHLVFASLDVWTVCVCVAWFCCRAEESWEVSEKSHRGVCGKCTRHAVFWSRTQQSVYFLFSTASSHISFLYLNTSASAIIFLPSVHWLE